MPTRHSILSFLLMAIIAIAGLSGCSKNSDDENQTTESPDETGVLTVYVVNYPLAYFAERIGGEHVDVHFPTPADEDPAFWMPNAETIAAYQEADLILLNGAGYAKWVARVALPQWKVVDTSSGFQERYITESGVVTHTHGPGGEHTHAGTAFTTWIDFAQAAAQAEAIKIAMADKRPALAPEFEANFETLIKDLRALDTDLAAVTAIDTSMLVVASHPVYQYLSRRYEIKLVSVMWEPGEAPTENQWMDFSAALEKHPAKWMLWEDEPLASTKEKLASMGIGIVAFNQCGAAPDNGDFMSVMRTNIENLKEAYRR